MNQHLKMLIFGVIKIIGIGQPSQMRGKKLLFKGKYHPYATKRKTSVFRKDESKTFVNAEQLGFGVLFVDGHTDKQMIPHIKYQDKTLVFMADLLPTAGHIPIPFVMGYDTRPLLTLNEKEQFMNKAADENLYLFLEHDAHNEIITVKHTEKGVRLDKSYTFNELFN